MYTRGVAEGVAKMNLFQLAPGGFSKLLELASESQFPVCLAYSSQLVCSCAQKQENAEQGEAGMKWVKPGLDAETGPGQVALDESVASAVTVQGPLVVHFAGSLGGITCQVMMEQGFVQCRIRAVAAPVRSRLKGLSGKLAKGLAQKGMTLEGFQVTP